MRGGEEFSIDDFSLKLEDLLTSTGQLADQNDLQVVSARAESRKWTSLSQPVSRRPSVHLSSHHQHTFDDLLNSQLSMNGFSTLSHVSQLDLGTAIHSLPPAPDLYTDFSFLLDRLEVPPAPGSGSSTGVAPVTSSPTTSNRGLSLSPLCFAHSKSRSRSNSPSTDTAGTCGDTSPKFELCDKAGGKVQKVKIPRHKRPSHQRAEAKRRTRIQDGLDQLRSLVPSSGDVGESLSTGSRSKNSKADLLRKFSIRDLCQKQLVQFVFQFLPWDEGSYTLSHTFDQFLATLHHYCGKIQKTNCEQASCDEAADYCRRLHMEYNSMMAETDGLRAELQALTAETKHYQEVLPADGVGQSGSQGPKISIEQMFSDYVHTRGLSNWKFWIFGQLIRPVFESYSWSVSAASGIELDKSVMGWARDYLSLIALRPALMSGLRSIVTSTSVVRHPERFEEEVRQAIMANSGLIPTTELSGSSDVVSSAR